MECKESKKTKPVSTQRGSDHYDQNPLLYSTTNSLLNPVSTCIYGESDRLIVLRDTFLIPFLQKPTFFGTVIIQVRLNSFLVRVILQKISWLTVQEPAERIQSIQIYGLRGVVP